VSRQSRNGHRSGADGYSSSLDIDRFTRSSIHLPLEYCDFGDILSLPSYDHAGAIVVICLVDGCWRLVDLAVWNLCVCWVGLADTEHGAPHLATYLVHYRVGDIVDIKANASEQKGMPHKCE
jgi:hypothetical protein